MRCKTSKLLCARCSVRAGTRAGSRAGAVSFRSRSKENVIDKLARVAAIRMRNEGVNSGDIEECFGGLIKERVKLCPPFRFSRNDRYLE